MHPTCSMNHKKLCSYCCWFESVGQHWGKKADMKIHVSPRFLPFIISHHYTLHVALLFLQHGNKSVTVSGYQVCPYSIITIRGVTRIHLDIHSTLCMYIWILVASAKAMLEECGVDYFLSWTYPASSQIFAAVIDWLPSHFWRHSMGTTN